MTPADAVIAIAIGLGAGVLSGIFGVGGGIVMTPAIDALLPVSLDRGDRDAAPGDLPDVDHRRVHLREGRGGRPAGGACGWRRPDSWAPCSGRSRRSGSTRRSCCSSPPRCSAGSRSASSAARAARGDDPDAPARAVSRRVFAAIGFVAGVVSGLLGIGGGLVMVPLLAGWCRMPLKRALGTSLLTISGSGDPGHRSCTRWLGNIDWWAALFLVDRRGAGRSDRRHAWRSGHGSGRSGRVVGTGMLVIAVLYAAAQLVELAR